MRIRSGRNVLIASALLAAACSDSAAVRLAVETDTLVVNGRRPVPIPLHAVGRDGRVVSRPRLTYTSNSSAAVVSKDGSVTCARTGDAVVVITRRAISTQVAVQCRPLGWVGLVSNVYEQTLWVGQPPQPLSVFARDSTGMPVRQLHGTATALVRDDSIARVIGGRLYLLSRGETRIDLDFEGVRGSAGIKVAERAVHDSLSLVGGELRTWRLPPGYYEMRLDPARGAHGLELAAYRANCANAPRHDGQHYFCILKNGSSIIVRNTGAQGANSELTGELTVFRLP
jgi:hypothetical protein